MHHLNAQCLAEHEHKAVSRILHHSYPYFIYEVIMKYIWEEYDVFMKYISIFFQKMK